jgi:uncharacterized protein
MDTKKEIVLSLIKKTVTAIDPTAEIILYGSRARGDERPDSDWDILILVNTPVDLKKEQVFRHSIFDVELETGEPISTFVFSKNDWEMKHSVTPLYYNISREGIRI